MPREKVRFVGPAERRALVVTREWDKWDEWRHAHQEEYGAAIWVLDPEHLAQWAVEVFDVVRL